MEAQCLFAVLPDKNDVSVNDVLLHWIHGGCCRLVRNEFEVARKFPSRLLQLMGAVSGIHVICETGWLLLIECSVWQEGSLKCDQYDSIGRIAIDVTRCEANASDFRILLPGHFTVLGDQSLQVLTANSSKSQLKVPRQKLSKIVVALDRHILIGDVQMKMLINICVSIFM